MSCGDICLAFLAVFFPPIAVWIKCGICSADSLLNLLLLILGYLPGLLHAWYIIAKYPDDYTPIPSDDPESDGGGGRTVTYYYVSHTPPPTAGGLQPTGTAATGQPDGGRAQREIQRMGSYGAIRGGGEAGQQQGQAQQGQGQQGQGQQQQQQQQSGGGVSAGNGSAQEGNQASAPRPPPSYAEAVQGDHKIQT